MRESGQAGLSKRRAVLRQLETSAAVIIRVENRARFTIISNVPIEDERLSWEALGVLCWLLSKPDGWEALRAAVANRKRGAGRDKVARIFAELQAADYMLRKKQQREDGRFEWSSLIFEEPFGSPSGKTVAGLSVNETGKPTTVRSLSVEPAAAEPSLENPALSKTQRSKTDRSKTQEAKTQEREEPSRAPSASFVIRRLKPWPEDFNLDSELGENRKKCRLRCECRIRSVQGLLHREREGIRRLARCFRRVDPED
jgi:hypothetical protein